MSTTALAALVLGAILAQVAAAVLLWLRGRPREGSDPRPAAAPCTPGPAAAGAGYRELVVVRRVAENAAGSVCSFHLAPADGRPLPDHAPGQYLTFKLSIPDAAGGAPRTVVRCYSLSDRPRPDRYRVTIKRLAAPAGCPEAPPGLSSGHFHEHVHEGDRLLAKPPAGHFHLVDGDEPVVLCAGGIGITPMLAIAASLLESGDPREVWLFYGVRDGAEHVMKASLEAMAAHDPRLHLHVCYSAPRATDRAGIDYRHAGHVDVALLRATLGLGRYRFYVCGPRAMMESLVPGLETLGVDPGCIHYESFGPASLARRRGEQAPDAAPRQSITVTFSRSGRSLPWDTGAGSLLEFAESHGITPESGCRAGSCGSCQTELEAGEVRYEQTPDVEIEPGHCLLCIGTPAGDVTLAA